MGEYYAKDGTTMTFEEWCERFGDEPYRRVGWSKTGYGPGKKRVSTVWLGLNHAYGGGGVVIFETMAFNVGSFESLAQDRYATLTDATRGHHLMRELYRYNRKQRRAMQRRSR